MEKLLGWSLPLGRISGIPVGLHWSFLLYAGMNLSSSHDAGLEVLWMLGLFGTVLLHELGHCWGARREGLAASHILLWPLGGLAFISPGRTAGQDIRVAAAGPAMHIPIGLVLAGILIGTGHPVTSADLNPLSGYYHAELGWAFNLCYQLLRMQVVLFALNLLTPAYPMDGGRILVAALSTRFSQRTVATVAITLSTAIGLGFLVLGLPFIGVMLLFEAANLYQLLQSHNLESYPLFHYSASYRIHKPKKNSGLRLVPSSHAAPPAPAPSSRNGERLCPHCSTFLNPNARMCGFCERTV